MIPKELSTSVKKTIRMEFIYNALESGWTVRKKSKDNSFEFLKTSNDFHSENKSYRRCVSAPLVLKIN